MVASIFWLAEASDLAFGVSEFYEKLTALKFDNLGFVTDSHNYMALAFQCPTVWLARFQCQAFYFFFKLGSDLFSEHMVDIYSIGSGILATVNRVDKDPIKIN